MAARSLSPPSSVGGKMRLKRGSAVLTAVVAAALLAFAAAAGPAAAASGSILVWNTFRGTGDDLFQKIAPAPGGVYAAGYTVGTSNDVLIVKNSAANRNLGYRDWDNPAVGGTDGVYAMAVDRFGSVVVAGATAGTGGASDWDLMVLKLDAASNPAWDVVLDGGVRGDDAARDVACDSDGNVYVTGWRTDAAGLHFWTLKLDAATGAIVWQAIYDNGDPSDMAAALCLDAQRNVYVTGSSRNVVAGLGSIDIATVKYDARGVQQWVVRSDGPGHGMEYANDIALGRAGALFVAGDCQAAPGSARDDADLLLIRLSTSGGQAWLRTLDDRSHWSNLGFALRVSSANSAYVAGTMSNGSYTRHKGIVARWNASGGLLWGRIWGSSGGRPAGFNDLVIDRAGTAWCAGYMTSSHPGNDKEGLVCKYSAGGRNLWASGWEGPGRRDDIFYAVTLQGSSSLFAAGSSAYRGRGIDGAIVKYAR